MKLLDLGDGLLYAPIPYIAHHLTVPEGTLRRWSVEDNWPRRCIRGRCYYLLSRAEQSYRDRRRHTAKGA